MVLQVQVDKGKNSRRCLDQLLSDRVHQRSTAPAFAVVRACRQLELPHARGRAMRTTWQARVKSRLESMSLFQKVLEQSTSL